LEAETAVSYIYVLMNEISCEIKWLKTWKLHRKIIKKLEVKDSRNKPGVAQRDPGGLGSQISITFSA